MITVLDLFGGIGGFRLGLENVSDRFETVDYIEKDKYAVKSYNSIFDDDYEPKDATELKAERLPDFNILCAGFPCQSFSVAGERKGFRDTRGTMFFQIARIVREKLPEILFLENVKGLLNHSNGQTFKKILKTLDELGYDAQWQVLNSKYHGVSQNRERVFIIANRRDKCRPKVFPFRETTEKDFEGVEREITAIGNNGSLKQTLGTISSGGNSAMDDSDADFLPVITPDFKKKDQNKKDRIGSRDNMMFTVDGTSIHGVTDGLKIRKLTPRECWRLQGFPDWAFEKAEEVNSDTQLYKQAGNSVTVPVIEDIGERLLFYFEKEVN